MLIPQKVLEHRGQWLPLLQHDPILLHLFKTHHLVDYYGRYNCTGLLDWHMYARKPFKEY